MVKQGRRELRSQVRLQVKVSGRDAQGNPFVQTAYARDTSFYGVRVDGIECLKGPGEIVEIKYKRKTSKFRVVWVGLPGSKEHGHIGLRSLEPRKNIWNLGQTPGANKPFFDSLPRTEAGPVKPQNSCDKESLPSRCERRRFTRHRCLGTVEFRIAGNCTIMSGKLTDVSLGGCYIQASGTCLPGTLLELAIEARKLRVQLNGRAVVAASSKGMGIEFVSGCDGLKDLPKFIEAVRRQSNAIPTRPVTLAARVQRPKPL
jgi:hypothetical protein